MSRGMQHSLLPRDFGPSTCSSAVSNGFWQLLGPWQEKLHLRGHWEPPAVDLGLISSAPSRRRAKRWQNFLGWHSSKRASGKGMSQHQAEVEGTRDKLIPHSQMSQLAPDNPIPQAGKQRAHRISLLQSRQASILCRLSPYQEGLASQVSSTGSPAADFTQTRTVTTSGVLPALSSLSQPSSCQGSVGTLA